MELDDEVCLCFHVTKRKILNFLRVNRPKRPGQLSDCFGAGTGCGWCRPYLKRYFREVSRGETAAGAELDRCAYASGRSQYVRQGRGTPPPGATPIDEEHEERLG